MADALILGSKENYMRKILFVSVLFISGVAWGQIQYPYILNPLTVPPSGNCAGPQIQVLGSNGHVWTCDNGTWADSTGGGGGGGTVTSVTFTGDGVVDSATPSSAVTTSGTVTATLLTQTANTAFGNFTGSTAAPSFTATTGTGSPVAATSPTLVTPNLGTPASGIITNLTGTCASCTANSVPAANLTGTTLASGVTASSLTSFGTAPALGTPASGVITNLTGTCTACTANVAGSVTNALTLNNSNSGAASGTTYNGSSAVTLSANTLGAGSLANANTWSAAQTLSVAGAASASPFEFTGALFTGGSGTSTFPYFMLQPSTATAETGWSANGTFIGVNSASGFTGNFIDFHLNNGASAFNVTSAGNLTAGGTISGTTISGNPIQAGTAIALSSTVSQALRMASTAEVSWASTANYTGTQDTTLCRSAAGVVEVGSSTACATSGSITALGLIGGSFQQQAASNSGGTCSMSTSTSCTITLGHTYTTPVCIVTQQSATLTGGAAGCTVSGTTVTITAAVANSETWGAFVFGNPN